MTFALDMVTKASEQTAATFDEVYESEFDFVWRSVRRLGVDASATDDVVQEVFLVVHRRLDEFQGRSTLRTWIYGIARHVANRHRRARQRRERALGGDAAHLPVEEMGDTDQPSAQDRAERDEARQLVERLLDELEDDRREILILVELEEMSVPEAASALRINRNTAYGRLRSARLDFERALARHRARERHLTGSTP